MSYDRAYQTYFSFMSDYDLKHRELTHLLKHATKHPFPNLVFEYLWKKYVYANEEAKSVLLWRCDNGADVLVKLYICLKI